MTTELKITSEQVQSNVPVTIFHIEGDIDTNTFQILQDQAKEAHQAGTNYLLLDLSGVKFVSSAGFRALHATYIMLRETSPDAVGKGLMDGTYKSRHLKLLHPSPNVLMALKTAGFDMYIESFDDLKKALESFN